MGKKNDNIHQIHINIPLELHNSLKEILPEKGMLTGLVRRFLRRYVSGIRGVDGIAPSPAEAVTDGIVREDLDRR